MANKQKTIPKYSDCIDKSPIPVEPAPPALVVRRNQTDLTADDQKRFKDAFTALIDEGFMTLHVGHHTDMSHRMHGSMTGDSVAFQRFLPWHRIYLWKLEQQLRRVDSQVAIPYWQWSTDHAFPAWLADFKPSGIVNTNGQPINIERNPGGSQFAPNLPTEADIAPIMQVPTYLPFASRLEGVPFGAHNQVHVWVGGTMNSVPIAPADPIFWMHHAEVDRLWHLWQQVHPNQNPTLSGPTALLDPWPEVATDARHIADLGYQYA